MNIKIPITLVFISLLFACCQTTPKQIDFVHYVNPLIGTAPATTISAMEHGHGLENNSQVVPCVTVPFGMTNWTPQTKATETKCDAPYYYTDSIFQGFRGSHWLSGSCVQDYGSMTIMPISGDLQCLPSKRGSKFSHDREKSTPYSYQVHLDDYHIEAEVTATKRSGLFQFLFEGEGEAHIVVNPNSDEGKGFVRILPESNEIIGYNPVHRIYQGSGEVAGFNGFFVAQFSCDFVRYGVYQGSNIFEMETQVSDLKDLGGYVSFQVQKNEKVYVRVGTSFTSIEQARENLKTETGELDFKQAKSTLRSEWESLLSKVQVEGEKEEDKVKFYTALYHSFLQPRTFNDCDGSYMSFAGGQQLMNSGNRDYYVDFSMWDTYRASHPLFNLLIPKISEDMMYSLLLKAEQGGWLPIFPCWNSYTSAMIGDHALVSLSDSYIKGIIDISDEQYAYLLQNAFELPKSEKEYIEGKGRRALKSYLQYGYVPLEDSVLESFHNNEQVSRTLEYAFDDFALSQIAQKKGDSVRANILKQRALNYQHVYSPSDSCVRGKYADGTFIKKFNKFIRQPYITEGTPYQYTWYVPHDVAGLMNLMGGQQAFNNNLDLFFSAGQYWHGNEPSHQISFLYNYSGQPWKTQQLVTNIMNTEYSTDVGGLSGNDDAGQMSAWYVFAAMGFYPVCPSVPQYLISGPHFDKITILLENKKKLVIHAPGASMGKNYIHGVEFNGVETSKTFLDHFELSNGGVIDFKMEERADTIWGGSISDKPFSMNN